ncbi:MAG: hypothetical protein GC179_01210 [Anaerolineaceae bacterium]|nr:hypothetical protein [Anaerolineaceae bacterium]
MKKFFKWLIYGVIAVCILGVCSFCGLFLWVGGIENQVFRQSLPVYPDAREVSNAYGYMGGGSGLQALYFWTAKPVEDVKRYYETSVSDFIHPSELFEEKARIYYSVFNPKGGEVPVVTREFGGEIINQEQSKTCYYRSQYNCVEITLIDFGTSQVVSLPPRPGPMRVVRTQLPLESELRGGTLIVYVYYVADIS